jgi:hypothetical protein
METWLNDTATAALVDAGARTAQFKDALAECLVGGGDVARLTEMVLHLVDSDQPVLYEAGSA